MELHRHANSAFSAGLSKENNLFKWEVTLFGPEGTPFEGGYFNANLKFPEDYPHSPPAMIFRTKMFHPNIYKTGEVCISILDHPSMDGDTEGNRLFWSPAHTAESVILSVISMLSDPNTTSPANPKAASMLIENRKEYNKTVREFVRKHAQGDD